MTRTETTTLGECAAYAVASKWRALKSVHDTGFTDAYNQLGELLLIYKDRYLAEVNDSDAAGFGARWPF
jgi:hypothetical protein